FVVQLDLARTHQAGVGVAPCIAPDLDMAVVEQASVDLVAEAVEQVELDHQVHRNVFREVDRQAPDAANHGRVASRQQYGKGVNHACTAMPVTVQLKTIVTRHRSSGPDSECGQLSALRLPGNLQGTGWPRAAVSHAGTAGAHATFPAP